MANACETLDDLILRLYDVEAVKFGSFTLKSGIESPVYFDLRVIVSYPKLMSRVSVELWKAAKDAGCKCDCVCGVPYTALPLATCIAANEDLPMVIRRKEAKDYGTKKMIEGSFKEGDSCLIIEDVVTSGSSVAETVQVLNTAGLTVTDAVVLLNREQGGDKRLAEQGIKLHSVVTISRVLEVLQAAGKLNQATVDATRRFVADNQTFALAPAPPSHKRKAEKFNAQEKAKRAKTVMTYADRAAKCTHPLSKRLFSIMDSKKTNLAFSVDVTDSAKLLELTEAVGPHICILKTHIDIVEDFSPSLIQNLTNLAEKHNFLIFEDRKFADIGHTVGLQYGKGVYHISDWAHIINAHALPGPGIVTGLKQIGVPKERGCLLIAEMSSDGNLCKEQYTRECVDLAGKHKDFVMGFICTSQVSTDPDFIHMTPGVRMGEGESDALGQTYLTPAEVIGRRRSDVIIVGRGILQAPDPAQAAQAFKEAGYKAYQENVGDQGAQEAGASAGASGRGDN